MAPYCRQKGALLTVRAGALNCKEICLKDTGESRQNAPRNLVSDVDGIWQAHFTLTIVTRRA